MEIKGEKEELAKQLKKKDNVISKLKGRLQSLQTQFSISANQ